MMINGICTLFVYDMLFVFLIIKYCNRMIYEVVVNFNFVILYKIKFCFEFICFCKIY